MKRNLMIAAMIAVLAAACGATSGMRIESNDLSAIQKGRSTKSEMIAKYGEPTETTLDSSGKETLIWYHTQTKTDAKTFIPIAGIFLGGGTSETTTLKVMLDKRGIVSDYEYSGGRYVSKLGSN